MASLRARVESIVEARTKRIAETVLSELQAACPKKSGRSAKSFHIEKVGRNYRVVSSKLSAYYADQGNGQGLIYPRRAKALKLTNGINRTLLDKNGKPLIRANVKTYEGAHFVDEVAKRHGG